jgi:hypothetical protein
MRRSARTPKKLAAYDPDEEASKPQFASSKTPKKSAPKKATLKAPKSPSPSPKAKSRSPSPKAASPAVAHYKPARASPSPPPAGAASRQLDPDSDSFLTLQAVIMVCAAAAFIEYRAIALANCPINVPPAHLQQRGGTARLNFACCGPLSPRVRLGGGFLGDIHSARVVVQVNRRLMSPCDKEQAAAASSTGAHDCLCFEAHLSLSHVVDGRRHRGMSINSTQLNVTMKCDTSNALPFTLINCTKFESHLLRRLSLPILRPQCGTRHCSGTRHTMAMCDLGG